MVKPRGIGNKNAFEQFVNSLSGSGILRVREKQPDTFTFDVNGPVVQLQKNQAVVNTVGRVEALKGILYVPGYDVGIGVAATSGYTTPSDGIYHVTANVAVSGVAIETYAGTVLVDGIAASGTTSFDSADARGAACVNINGVVHAAAGQVINVGVKSLHGTLITIGSEDLVDALAANITVIKLGSDELGFDG